MNNAKVKTVTVFVCLIIVTAFLSAAFASERHIVREYGLYKEATSETPFGEITAEHSLAAPLYAEEEVRLDRISIMLATYARENTCEVDFYLYKNGENVYSYTIKNASIIPDNDYFDLEDIDVVLSPEDKVYLLITSPDGQQENAITVWMRLDETEAGTYAYNVDNNEGIAAAQHARLSFYGETAAGAYVYNSDKHDRNEDVAAAQYARLSFYRDNFLGTFIPAAIVVTAFCALIFLQKNRLWNYFSQKKTAIQAIHFREIICSQTMDTICALLTMFFCCGILQSVCFSQLQLPPFLSTAGCLLMLFIAVFFKKLATRTLSVCSVVLTFSISMLLTLGSVNSLTNGFLYGIREPLYYAVVLVLCIAMPVVFARKWATDCLVHLAAAIRKHAWLAVCALVAAGGGTLIDLGYSQVTQGGVAVRRSCFFAGIVFIAIVFLMKRNQLLQAPEKLFLLIALPIGIFMTVPAPINAGISWDGDTHYERIVDLSQNVLTEFTEADRTIVDRKIPFSLSESERNNFTLELQEFYKSSDISIGISQETTHLTSIGYLPAAMGILAGKISRLPFPAIFILGRLGTFLCYVAAIYYAIKRLINGKMLLMVIGLIPTNLFLASNYSYDPWVTSLTILSFAYFWGALQRPNDKITVKECAMILTALYLGIWPKYIYFILFFIFLLIPKEKFSSEKAWRRFLLAVTVCIIASVIYLAVTYTIPVAAGTTTLTDTRGGADVNGRRQILFILTHPFTYAKILLTFLWQYLSLDAASGYISSFAYLGGTTAHTLPMVMMFVAAVTDCVEVETLGQRIHIRALSALILFATAAAIATSLYIVFTPVGLSTVNGCQLRYLLPLVFPFFALAFHHGTKFHVKRTVYNGMFFALSFYTVVSTFWNLYAAKIIP